MTVYVDDFAAPLRRMKMCHMLADTENELHDMALKIGVAFRHFQGDHYDICQQMKRRAIALGAHQITRREAVIQRRKFRDAAKNKSLF